MGTWQDIFEAKIADMDLREPWMLQEDDSLQVHDLKPGWKEFVQRRACGRFQCSQCFHEWPSAKVHMLFCTCWCQGQGMVCMRAFRQTCRRCPDPQLEEPKFSQETMEMLLHNLVLKILQYFCHLPIQPSDLLEVVVDMPVGGAHDSARCEGCQLAVCNKRLAPALDARETSTDANETGTHSTLKCQSMKPWAIPTHHPLSSNSNFPWKRCCYISTPLLFGLAVLLFVLLYFTMK
ncbi:LOW QUALITY PROTEIN: receptor-transporting protein 3-like [Balearica regulorum gibbericeps]|uniref:LOW QUALITY PROTEIN: receptor-transporting protein 3-like n=1 Tax=Balearica regulorum gibbericeps TaxID=100784 RepID=UPI003F637E76